MVVDHPDHVLGGARTEADLHFLPARGLNAPALIEIVFGAWGLFILRRERPVNTLPGLAEPRGRRLPSAAPAPRSPWRDYPARPNADSKPGVSCPRPSSSFASRRAFLRVDQGHHRPPRRRQDELILATRRRILYDLSASLQEYLDPVVGLTAFFERTASALPAWRAMPSFEKQRRFAVVSGNTRISATSPPRSAPAPAGGWSRPSPARPPKSPA